MKRLAVLISNVGVGTNLRSIIDRVESGKIKGQVVLVVSYSEDAPGLVSSREHHIHNKVVKKEDNLEQILKDYKVDYVCLTGWKQIIPDSLLDLFKILNVHPGLIPETKDGVVKNPDNKDALWNKGKFTNAAIKNFLDQKATYAGSTVHFLSHEFDFGPVLGRCFEKIIPVDTVESLYSRLKQKENQLYVDVLAKLCKEDIQ